jgi:AcrR family transcriptional regulator
MPSRKSIVLPPGRHTSKLAPGQRLPREIVAASQRERLIIATAELVPKQGYPATTVAQLTRRASVSRAAFYEHFANREECLLATCEELMARGAARVMSAYRTPELDWQGQLRAALEAYLLHAQTWPQGMHLCIADATSAGPRVVEQRARTLHAWARMIATCLSQAPDHSPLSPNLTRALLGGIFRVTYMLVSEDRAQELPTLLDDIETWMLVCRHPPAVSANDNTRKRRNPTKKTAGKRVVDAPARNCEEDSPAQDQRARIIDAVVELASTIGYVDMTHRQIATYAGVSYTTFYKHFKNKQEALLGADEVGDRRVQSAVAAATAAALDWPTAVRAGLDAVLRSLADAPAYARLRFVEIPKLGPPGFRRIDATLAEYHRLLDPGYEQSPKRSRILIEAILGAINEVVYDHASSGREQELPSLLPELTYIALAPFIGSEQAAKIAVQETGSQGAESGRP